MNIVCYSGGHSSALVAIEAVKKYGKENVVLLNHNISSKVEHEDIKRFKRDVADYLNLPITYANVKGFEDKTPLQICKNKCAFQTEPGKALCTHELKTKPFHAWLRKYYPAEIDKGSNTIITNEEANILYGFDKNETARIQRRSSIMASKGYRTDFPLAYWDRTVECTEDIGIKRPRTYKIFKHANCVGCLKAGMQHWFVVYCLRSDLFQEAVEAEREIGYSIIKDVFLEELITKYEDAKAKGICPNDIENGQTFWARVNRSIPEQLSFLPCDCALD